MLGALLIAGCTADAEPTVVAPPPATSEPANAEVAQSVPFPPAQNIKEWPEVFLQDPREVVQDALIHPLAVGLLDASEVAELFGGDWTLDWALVAEASDEAQDLCRALVPPTSPNTTGISASYSNTNDRGAIVWLLQGNDSDLLFGDFADSLACALQEAQAVDTDVQPVPGADDQFSLALSSIDGLGAQHLTLLGVRKGDLIAVFGAAAPDADAVPTTQQLAAQAIAIMLQRLGQ